MKRAAAPLLMLLTALVVVACGSGTATSASPSTAASRGSLVVQGAWARAAAAGGDTAVYFTIANGQDAGDTLLSAASDAAQSAGVHQTTTDASGMTGMHMTPSVAVPAGGTVSFAPGGYHVMLTSLKHELKAGDQLTLTLTFQNAGVVTVTAQVRAN